MAFVIGKRVAYDFLLAKKQAHGVMVGLPFDIPRTRDQPADPDGSPGGAAGHASLPTALDEQH